MRLSKSLGMLIALLAHRAGMSPTVERLRSTPWASAHLSGARHRIALLFDGDGAQAAARRVAHGLDSGEFDLGGHILADVAVLGSTDAQTSARVVIEALTLSEN